MLSFLYVYSDHSILECYNLFSGVELSMRSFFVTCTFNLPTVVVFATYDIIFWCGLVYYKTLIPRKSLIYTILN